MKLKMQNQTTRLYNNVEEHVYFKIVNGVIIKRIRVRTLEELITKLEEVRDK